MDKLLDKIFFRSKNLDYISQNIKDFTDQTPANKIFKAINSYSEGSEARYVGGCIRKVIKKETVDDIDLATNLNPQQVCKALHNNNISFYETGIKHGTITAVIDDYRFEITSLREDIDTDGRHAEVKFSTDWKKDASRRDFTINSIYSDLDGNLFDPFNGKQDLENGDVKFIGDPEKRIKEDYLRILRYVRFFLNYSKKKHDSETVSIIKRNLNGFSKISSDRLLDEFEKLIRSEGFLKLPKDKDCLEIINLIFPQFKNINIFDNLNNFAKKNFIDMDFVFLLSLMIIDGTDNVDYFIYKFNISKKDQKRLLFLNTFYSQKITSKTFTEKNLNKILYYNGREILMDVVYFNIFKSKKINNKLIKVITNLKDKILPSVPIKADVLMSQYNIKKGKELGKKLKIIEELWVENNFQISEKEVKKIIKN